MTTTNLRASARTLLSPLTDVHTRRAIAIVCLPLFLALLGAVLSAAPAAQPVAATPAPIIILATATPAPIAVSVLAPPARAIVGYFDYTRPETAAAVLSVDVVQIVGVADAWRLVELVSGARVWIRARDLPAGTREADDLPNLAAPTAPPVATIVYVEVLVQPDTPAEPPRLLAGERLDEYFERTGIKPETVR